MPRRCLTAAVETGRGARGGGAGGGWRPRRLAKPRILMAQRSGLLYLKLVAPDLVEDSVKILCVPIALLFQLNSPRKLCSTARGGGGQEG